MEKITFPYFMTWTDANNTPVFALDIHRIEFMNNQFFYNIDYSVPCMDLDLHPKIKTLDRVIKNCLYNGNHTPVFRLVRQICTEVISDPVLREIGIPDELRVGNKINWSLLSSRIEEEDEDRSFNCKWSRFADKLITEGLPFSAFKAHENTYLFRSIKYVANLSIFEKIAVPKKDFLSMLHSDEIFEIADIINDIERIEYLKPDFYIDIEEQEDRMFAIYDKEDNVLAFIIVEEKRFIKDS